MAAVPDGGQSVSAIVEVDGSPLLDELRPVVEQVVVDQSVQLADMFSITFRDVERTVLGKAQIKVGTKIRVSGTELGGIRPVLLVAGEVTSVEGDYHQRGSRTVVRGYDASHRMNVGRTTKTYEDTTDTEIVRDKAKVWGVDAGTIDDSGTRYEHVSQVNVSDWEFLKARAAAIGFELSVSDGKLNFRKPKSAADAPSPGDYTSSNPLTLVFGQDLLEFRPRITAAGQVTDVTVRSWDYRKKEAIEHGLRADTTSVSLPDSAAALASKFHSPKLAVVDRPYATQAEVENAAGAVSDHVASSWAEADGVVRGNPGIRAGSATTISVVAAPFAGNYTLTRARHVFDHQGYRTEFVVSGRHERSLLGLATAGASSVSASGSGKIQGVVVAIVTNIDDPEKLGRVKLRFPWLDPAYQSDWARVAQLGAGPASGAVFLAEVNDEVLVAFEFGDVGHPIVIGNLYNGKDKPNLGDGLIDHGKLKRRGFVSRTGHKFVFFEDKSKSGVAILSANGKMKISINETSGEIQIKTDRAVSIEAGTGMKLKAGTSLELEGASVKIKGSGTVEVSGAMIKLN